MIRTWIGIQPHLNNQLSDSLSSSQPFTGKALPAVRLGEWLAMSLQVARLRSSNKQNNHEFNVSCAKIHESG